MIMPGACLEAPDAKGSRLSLPASGYKSQRTYSSRKTACVIGVVHPVENGHLGKVEWAYPVQAGNVHSILVWIGSALMVRVDPAFGAEEMLRRSGIEAITCQRILAPKELNSTHVRRGRYRAAHPAIGAGTAANGVEPIGKCRFKANSAAMALSGSHVRFA
jgi:hypothetical protein